MVNRVEEQIVKFGKYETWVRLTHPGDRKPRRYPVFVLHGGPGMAHNYVLSFEQLADGGRTVYHYDQLGCGKSTHLPQQDPSF